LHPPQDLYFGGDGHLVTEFMERFHYRCRERRLPPLDSLVVHVAGPRRGAPGAGYFKVNGQDDPWNERTRPERQARATQFWETEKTECRTWGVQSRHGHLQGR
jgi:hypothetical protein